MVTETIPSMQKYTVWQNQMEWEQGVNHDSNFLQTYWVDSK